MDRQGVDEVCAHDGILLPTRENPPNHALHACVLHDAMDRHDAMDHHDDHTHSHDHGMGLLHDDRNEDSAHPQSTLE